MCMKNNSKVLILKNCALAFIQGKRNVNMSCESPYPSCSVHQVRLESFQENHSLSHVPKTSDHKKKLYLQTNWNISLNEIQPVYMDLQVVKHY